MTEKMIKARVLVDSIIWLPIQKAIESVGLTLDDIIEDKAIKNHFTDLCFAVAYNKLRKENPGPEIKCKHCGEEVGEHHTQFVEHLWTKHREIMVEFLGSQSSTPTMRSGQ